MSNGFSALSLQQKVSLTLLAVMTVLAVLSYAILTSMIAPAFDRLELDTARTNLNRAANSIQTDLDNLDAMVRDWAPWDDAYAYARGEYPEFEQSNLNRPTLAHLNLNPLAGRFARGYARIPLDLRFGCAPRSRPEAPSPPQPGPSRTRLEPFRCTARRE